MFAKCIKCLNFAKGYEANDIGVGIALAPFFIFILVDIDNSVNVFIGFVISKKG